MVEGGLDDWWSIERATHDHKDGMERIGPNAVALTWTGRSARGGNLGFRPARPAPPGDAVRGSALGTRSTTTAREYICGCGHVGWSAHVDLCTYEQSQ